MAYEFMSLAEVEALSEVPENATVLAEVGGSIKRIPGEGLGGGKSLVIVESSFTDFYANTPSPKVSGPSYTYTANMEFADAFAAFRACELTNVVLYTFTFGPMFLNCIVVDLGATMSEPAATATSEPVQTIDCLGIMTEFAGDRITLYWTADGISNNKPGGVEQ